MDKNYKLYQLFGKDSGVFYEGIAKGTYTSGDGCIHRLKDHITLYRDKITRVVMWDLGTEDVYSAKEIEGHFIQNSSAISKENGVEYCNSQKRGKWSSQYVYEFIIRESTFDKYQQNFTKTVMSVETLDVMINDILNKNGKSHGGSKGGSLFVQCIYGDGNVLNLDEGLNGREIGCKLIELYPEKFNNGVFSQVTGSFNHGKLIHKRESSYYVSDSKTFNLPKTIEATRVRYFGEIVGDFKAQTDAEEYTETSKISYLLKTGKQNTKGFSFETLFGLKQFIKPPVDKPWK